MQTNLALLLQEDVFKYFHEISQIPRESGNEKAVSNYIYKLMETEGLNCYQDNLSNLIIKKNGQGKSAHSKPIILQAHLDMVCVKTENSTHNFESDPITWQINDDLISSDKGTSLGADCGIGVALVMAVLMNKQASHPPIEAVLTTREETDMLGAYGISAEKLSAKRMINFDISPDNRLLTGSCGGVAIELKLPVEFIKYNSKNKKKSFTISLEGMKGGHSGANINSGHGNAITLLARMLNIISKEISYDLVNLEGGNSRLAIPTFARATIVIDSLLEQSLVDTFDKIIRKIIEELLAYSDDAKFSLYENEAIPDKTIAKSDMDKIIKACLLLPTGIQEMNSQPKNTVESSCNLGIVKLEEEQMIFVSEIRSAHKSTREFIMQKHEILADILGYKVTTHSTYSSWKYSQSSSLRDIITNEYKSLFNKDMEIVVAHSGNEIGIFYDKIENLDAIAMGPTREKYHTPNEVLSISSTRNHYRLLLNALSSL